MPIYTYKCESCGSEKEHFVFSSERNNPCDCACGGTMKRRGLETFSIGAPEYQMQAVLSDGTHVPGHFGKDAKRKRKKKNATKTKT